VTDRQTDKHIEEYFCCWCAVWTNGEFDFRDSDKRNMKRFLPRDATQSAVLLWQSRLSVFPSVTLRYRDHIGWNSSKINSPLVSLGCSLFADPTSRIYAKGNLLKFWPEYGWGIDYRIPTDVITISNISETQQDETNVTIEHQ